MLPSLFLGESAALRPVLRQLEDFAPTPFPVVLLGPTGSGKTVLAQLIHDRSGRKGRFVDLPLPMIPDELRHSVLAGHARGAFTGATEAQIGKIEEAHGGTLFLDELSLATRAVQQVLLQALDCKWVCRLGEQTRRQVDCRFVFATNVDPLTLLKQGTWAGDFYHRIGYNRIRLPGLTDRPDDIIPLGERFLGEALQQIGKTFHPRFSPEVEAVLLRYRWPGNLRELRNVCEHAAARLQADRSVQLAELPEALMIALSAAEAPRVELEQEQVAAVLHETGGNKSEAARRLRITRQSLLRLLERRDRRTPSGGLHRT